MHSSMFTVLTSLLVGQHLLSKGVSSFVPFVQRHYKTTSFCF